MITHVLHIVLVTLRSDISDVTRERLRHAARTLPERIPGIIEVTEGPSISPEGLEDGFDYGFVIRFRSPSDRDAYLPHPSHLEFAQMLRTASDRIVVYDIPA